MLSYLLWLVWTTIVVLVPGLGVWLATSLAVYLGGPVWLACVAGLLLFPGLPLAWEWWATARRAGKGKTGTRALGTWDRIVLRTLAVNLLFAAVLVARFPKDSFTALSARGDWFLEGKTGDGAMVARAVLFRTAGGLEWLHRLARKNPYEVALTRDRRRPPEKDVRPLPVPVTAPVTESSGSVTSVSPPAQEDALAWPLPEKLHPLVETIPPGAEESPAAVARWIASRESDHRLRVKALHDWVADRIAYDAEALAAGRYPPQDVATVFQRRTAVCAGYANLLSAMGEAAGEEIVVIAGDARTEGTDVAGGGHAWNAARLDGKWLLLDATWDAGSVKGPTFTKKYTTSYLFVPPEVIGVSHFPEEQVWQLREPALSRGEFLRQPMLGARFFSEGLSLVSPSRSQVTVSDSLRVEVRNPRGRFLLGKLSSPEGGPSGECRVENGAEASLVCPFPSPGPYTVTLFVGPQLYGRYAHAGEVAVVSRGRG